MPDTSLDLRQIIAKEIKHRGPVTFARYMDLCLYHPQHGYYNTARTPLGKDGDYYTSVHLGSAFGRCMARQMEEMWRKLGEPEPFFIIEYGAGDGHLAQDVLANLQGLTEICQYRIIEKSCHLRSVQEQRLSGFDQVRWVNEIKEISGEKAPVVGCVFSNELVDAFPVHRVVMASEGLKELYVTVVEERFQYLEGTLSTGDIARHLSRHGIELVDGQVAEINLAAAGWLEEVAFGLDRGYILTVDYGDLSRILYDHNIYPAGTLSCYRQHSRTDDPLIYPGEQDITAHVDFSALQEWGAELGLANLGLVPQRDFLIGNGILESLETGEEWSQRRFQELSAIKSLILPGGMGDQFKVLLQSKGLDGEGAAAELSGLKKLY